MSYDPVRGERAGQKAIATQLARGFASEASMRGLGGPCVGEMKLSESWWG